jgi:hypothetical protein
MLLVPITTIVVLGLELGIFLYIALLKKIFLNLPLLGMSIIWSNFSIFTVIPQRECTLEIGLLILVGTVMLRLYLYRVEKTHITTIMTIDRTD